MKDIQEKQALTAPTKFRTTVQDTDLLAQCSQPSPGPGASVTFLCDPDIPDKAQTASRA